MSDDRRRITLSEDDFGQPGAGTPGAQPPDVGPPIPGPGPTDAGRPELERLAAEPIQQVVRSSGRFAWLSAIPAAAVAAVAVTVAVTVGVVVVVAKPEEKTPADFCRALDEGTEDIKANLPNTDAEGAEAFRQLIIAFGGFGRFQTMLDNMVEESPDEIKTEMTTSRDTFKESMDAVPGTAGSAAGGDLGGALTGLLTVAFKGIVNQPSFEKVDAYAQEHCGSTVFGSPPQ